MANSIAQPGRKMAYKVVTAQAVVTLIASIIALSWGIQSARSVALGGLICVIPAWYFAHKFFQQAGASAAQQVVRAFYLAEAVKLILTALLFVLVFIFVPVIPGALLAGYGLALFVHWIAPLMVNRR